MSTAKAESKVARYWWLALVLLCLVPCLTPLNCGYEPRAVVAGIPLGSKLSELDDHLGKFYDSSSVEEWGNVPTENKATNYMKGKYGFTYFRKLGDYEHWTASKVERDAFTGEIVFYHQSSVIPDDLAPSYAVSLVYVKGVLKDKHFSIMPG